MSTRELWLVEYSHQPLTEETIVSELVKLRNLENCILKKRASALEHVLKSMCCGVEVVRTKISSRVLLSFSLTVKVQRK